MAQTLYDKLWQKHVVAPLEGGEDLLYIDRHLIHEVTSPQAFEGLELVGRKMHSPKQAFAVPDHNVPTTDRHLPNPDKSSEQQLAALEANAHRTGVHYIPIDDPKQGIVHVVWPELGITLPGITLVCGDSHTSTHGAFGALAFGIGTSEIEHVMATQTLRMKKAKNMRVTVSGDMPISCSAKDIALALIGKIGANGGTGYVIEYAGSMITSLSLEARMTLCNMTIEAGARAGIIAPDEKVFDYVKGRPFAPTDQQWDDAMAQWQQLKSDEDAHFDRELVLTEKDLSPMVTWGTSPEEVIPVAGRIPDPAQATTPEQAEAMKAALDYMGLQAGGRLADYPLDRVFIGSCTNSRLEDLRIAAHVVKGKKVAASIKQALVVPGSGLVKRLAEEEGLDQIFINAGFEWRQPGCSMCLGMNPDKAAPGERVASTSNRNFKGRQGPGSRTHLASPATVAAAAIAGYFIGK